MRKLGVWLPPQYGEAQGRGDGRRFPVLYDLVGFTGSGLSHTNWKPFSDNVPERVARLIHEKKMGPVILVFPDCFTALGGNQYVNSPAIGNYADYLTREIIPFVDRRFRTLPGREHRGDPVAAGDPLALRRALHAFGHRGRDLVGFGAGRETAGELLQPAEQREIGRAHV